MKDAVQNFEQIRKCDERMYCFKRNGNVKSLLYLFWYHFIIIIIIIVSVITTTIILLLTQL